MADEPKKGLFGKAIDALTSRDEKAAAEEAQRKAAEAQAQAAAAKAEAAKLAAEKAAAQKEAEEARAKAAAETAKAAELKRQEYFREMAEAKAKAEAAAAPKYIAEHTITGETLSDVSLKYYGNATRPYFMVIYEANKDVIGPDPGKVRPGMKLKIPELPEELKKK